MYNASLSQKSNLVLSATVLKTLGRVGSVFLRTETSIIKTPTKTTRYFRNKNSGLPETQDFLGLCWVDNAEQNVFKISVLLSFHLFSEGLDEKTWYVLTLTNYMSAFK